MAFVTGAFPEDDKFPPSDNDDWKSIKRRGAVAHYFDAAGNHLNSDIRLGGFEIEGETAIDRGLG